MQRELRAGVRFKPVLAAVLQATFLGVPEVLENPTCAERLVASGQQRAEEFSMDNRAARYVELYEQVA